MSHISVHLQCISLFLLYHTPIRFVAVVVVPLLTDEDDLEQPSEYLENNAYFEDIPENEHYVTAAWDLDTINFVPEQLVVGDETIYTAEPPNQGNKVNYTNVPLRPNTNYAIFVRYDIDNDESTEVSACGTALKYNG